MVYEYQCTNSDFCGAITEHTQRMSDPIADFIVCPFCESAAKYKYSRVSVLTGNMTNHTFDVAVGVDAEKRWTKIYEQQAIRDKARKESGSVGLQGVAPNTYRPITEQQKQTRTRVTNAVERDGYRTETPGLG
jgi:hypothetical protein